MVFFYLPNVSKNCLLLTGVAAGETTVTVEYKVGEEVKLTKTANVEVTAKA